MHLQQQAQDYYAWSQAQPQLLKVSQNSDRQRDLTQQWLRPQDLPQMDLFMDNAAVVAENTLLDYLAARDFNKAQSQLDKLTTLNASHEKLGRYQDLINYGHHMAGETIQPGAIAAELEGLENEVAPLAKALLNLDSSVKNATIMATR